MFAEKIMEDLASKLRSHGSWTQDISDLILLSIFF